MPEIHFSVLVLEDSILYDLPHIKEDVLNNGIIQQGVFCSHFAHIFHRHKARRNELMSPFGDVSQMLSLEVHNMPPIVGFPLTVVIVEHSKYFGVVGVFLKSIVSFIIDRFQVIELVDRLRTEIYQHPSQPFFFFFFTTSDARLA